MYDPSYDPAYDPYHVGGTPQRMLDELADSLRDQVVEGYRIYDVKVAPEFLADYGSWIRVTVLVDDPLPGAPVWSEEILVFDDAIRRRAESIGIGLPVYVTHVTLRSAVSVGYPAEVVARARAAGR